MAVYKCKMCGGDLEIKEGVSVCECEYCGSRQTVPAADNEKKMNLFGRANRLRFANEFDKAAGVYESIISDFPEEAEAYWGLVLCKYGIEYVDDPSSGNKIPTCHRSSFDSVMDDSNFEQTLENADSLARGVYREEAKQIEELRKGIIEVSSKEEPYDIFICYKETAENGDRTVDSVIAQDVYDALTEKGYRVFFSRISLEDKLGVKYEPYIFAALNSAKIMLAFGTDYEYFNAVWVKNEWSRFLQLIAKGEKKTLIPCYKGIDAYDMPKEFAKLQAQDMGKVGAIQDLLRGIEKILPKKAETEKSVVVQSSAPAAPGVDSLLERAFMFLEDRNWNEANAYCEKVLDIDPKCARAYLGKLMAELKVNEKEQLAAQNTPFDQLDNYKKVLRFADGDLKKEIAGYTEKVNANLAEQKERERIKKEQEAEQEREQERVRNIKREKIKNVQGLISVGNDHSLGLKTDGTVVACGNNDEGQCNVKGWCDIVAISAGVDHSLGLKSDGTVVACGGNTYGQCKVESWHDIVAISAGERNSLGLKSDGTVVACGKNEGGKCDVENWRDIVAIFAGDHRSLGLKSDGTVVAGGIKTSRMCDVKGWRDIVAVFAGEEQSLGLKSDGTVVACGLNDYGECEVNDWSDIIAITIDGFGLLGLKTNGTVVARGLTYKDNTDINGWRDIIAIYSGKLHSLGLKTDGTVVACGYNRDGRCDVKGWRDIVAISAGFDYSLGLKSDGTVVACGKNDYGQCNVKGWKLFDDYSNLENERAEKRRLAEERIQQKQAERKQRGLCPYCGGTFKGLFSKKCTACGKPKDY